MKGLGTDENAIIEVLCRRTNEQRMNIIKAYKATYENNLLDDIHGDTSGDFLNILIALLTHTSEFYATELLDALYGKILNEETLIEIICNLSRSEMSEISQVFERNFKKSLKKSLREKSCGGVRNFLLALFDSIRDDSKIEEISKAKEFALELKESGIDREFADESVFIRILCNSNCDQLLKISEEYQKLIGRTLRTDVEDIFDGMFLQALLTLLEMAENPAKFFAQKLHKSMKGLGTDDRTLIRVVVTRCEIDMENIKLEFQKIYEKSLKSFISGDTSGDYKRAFKVLIGEK